MHVRHSSCAVFLFGIRWRHSKPRNSWPHFLVSFYQFEEGQRRQLCMDLDTVLPSVRGLDVLYNALNVL